MSSQSPPGNEDVNCPLSWEADIHVLSAILLRVLERQQTAGTPECCPANLCHHSPRLTHRVRGTWAH